MTGNFIFSLIALTYFQKKGIAHKGISQEY